MVVILGIKLPRQSELVRLFTMRGVAMRLIQKVRRHWAKIWMSLRLMTRRFFRLKLSTKLRIRDLGSNKTKRCLSDRFDEPTGAAGALWPLLWRLTVAIQLLRGSTSCLPCSRQRSHSTQPRLSRRDHRSARCSSLRTRQEATCLLSLSKRATSS